MKTIGTQVTNSESCPACGVAKNKGDYCNYCGMLYPEARKADQIENAAPLSSLASKYQVEPTQDGLCIWWSWRSLPLLFFFAFALLWNFTVFDSSSLLPKLIGIGMIAAVVVGFLNRTTIYITSNGISVQHRPIPCRRGYKFSARDVEQVYVSRELKRSKKTTWHAPALQLVTTDGKRHVILNGQSEADFADFETLRRKILSELGVEPKNVFGEFSGNGGTQNID